MTPTLIAILVALGVVGGGTGGWFARKALDKPAVEAARADQAEADERARVAEADVAKLREAGNLVSEAVRVHLTETQTVAGVLGLETLRLVCDPPEGGKRDDLACMVLTVCAQAKAGTVPVTACDTVVNEWVSERWIATVEGGNADPATRADRLRIFERRK